MTLAAPGRGPRRRIAALLLAAVAASLAVPGAAGLRAGELFRRGDVNDDRRIDISDGIAVFSFLFLGAAEPACLDAADANDDGGIDVSDGVFVLNFLFQGGPPMPAPGPGARCPGLDPTSDELDCAGGADPPSDLPRVELRPVQAQAPGIRQRSRFSIERMEDGVYRIARGVSFTLLVEAHASPISRAGLSLHAPGDPLAGDPAALDVRCDRDLGEPASGGAPAGMNLAPLFFRDTDPWSDPIYLIEHAALRIAGDGALAPAPGRYTFTAVVTDAACARSEPASFTLVVDAAPEPEIFAWIESGGRLLQHDPGTGNARIGSGEVEAATLVIEARAALNGDSPPDPASLRVTAAPALAGGEDLTAALVPDGESPARFLLPLEEPWAPAPGDTDLSITMSATSGRRRTIRFRIEAALSHEADIAPIWRAGCTGCHEEPNPFKGLVLVAPSAAEVYRNIVNVFAAEPELSSIAPLFVRPYFPERSYIVHKLRGTHLDPAVAGSGVRMPADGGFLDETAMHLIESWIAQGAPR